MDEKACRLCGEIKPLDQFYAMRGMRDGHRNDCIDCNRAARRARAAANPEAYRERSRQWARDNPERRAAYQAEYRKRPERRRPMRDLYYRRTYGISADDYDAMYEAQQGRCAICGTTPSNQAQMHVDHHHETGALRELLCSSCNQALGQLKDDPRLLRAAAEYLERHGVTGS